MYSYINIIIIVYVFVMAVFCLCNDDEYSYFNEEVLENDGEIIMENIDEFCDGDIRFREI